jgi:hypothetical protein
MALTEDEGRMLRKRARALNELAENETWLAGERTGQAKA